MTMHHKVVADLMYLAKTQIDFLFWRQERHPEDEARFVPLVGRIVVTFWSTALDDGHMDELWEYTHEKYHQYRKQRRPECTFEMNKDFFERLLVKHHLKGPKASKSEKRVRMYKKIYEMKVSLRDIEPPISRVFAISGNMGLSTLHRVLQVVMGWQDSHLHQYHIDDTIYTGHMEFIDEFPENREYFDENDFRVRSLLKERGDQCVYEYDFGDYWLHDLEVLKTGPPEEGVRYPVCLAGEGACPPEDVGGTSGYAEFPEALAEPTHDDHERMLTWVGSRFDPEFFDIEAVNAKLRKLR